MFLIAEPLRNLGKYTFADVVAYRLSKSPIRTMAAISSIITVLFYLIAQMVGAGSLIKLMFPSLVLSRRVVCSRHVDDSLCFVRRNAGDDVGANYQSAFCSSAARLC